MIKSIKKKILQSKIKKRQKEKQRINKLKPSNNFSYKIFKDEKNTNSNDDNVYWL